MENHARKLMFDTLNYAKILDSSGVSHPDVHASALNDVLGQNIYSKNETDTMYEAALKRFDERTVEMREQIREEMRRDREEFRHKMDRDREEFSQKMDRDREEIRRDFNSLQGELRSEMRDLQLEMKQIHGDLRIEIKEMGETILKKVYLTASLVLAGVGVISAFTHLFH
jgi:hypothetical protein